MQILHSGNNKSGLRLHLAAGFSPVRFAPQLLRNLVVNAGGLVILPLSVGFL